MTMIRFAPEEFAQDNNFETAIKKVLANEGGFANDEDDSGGITKYGITLFFLKGYNIDLNGDGIIDAKDIMEMTLPQARWVYRKFIWELNHYGKFIHSTIATKAFDMGVNMGESQATKLLQRAINLLSQPDIVVDGVRGPKTIDNANKLEETSLLHELRIQSMAFYKGLVEKKPSNQKFLKGWLRRAAQ